jgi:hypothetical protein
MEWLIENNTFAVLLGKTGCILFGPRRKLKTITDFQINCNCHLIKWQSIIKYLGIDTKLYLVLSLNSCKFGDYVDRSHPLELDKIFVLFHL